MVTFFMKLCLRNLDNAELHNGQEDVFQELEVNTFAPKNRLIKADTNVRSPVGAPRDAKENVAQESENDNFAPKKSLPTTYGLGTTVESVLPNDISSVHTGIAVDYRIH